MSRILLFILLIITLGLSAQKLEHLKHRITSEEGLPDKQIYNLVEDEKGFIWVAASSGLYKYDGKEFKLFRHVKQNKNSVFGLILDSQGRIWYNTIDGQYFYIKNDKIVFFKHFKNKIEALCVFSVINNYLYINSISNEIVKINITTRKESRISKKNITTAVFEHNNTLKVLSFNGIYNLEQLPKLKSTENYLINDKQLLLNDGKILYLGSGRKKNNHFKIYENNKASSISLNDFEALKHVAIYNAKIINNYIWFFTARGAFKYSYAKGIFKLDAVFLKGKQTTDAVIDKQGYLLISTVVSGIYVIPSQSIFRVKRTNKDEYISSFEAINDSIISYIEGKKYFSVLNTASLESQGLQLKSYNQLLFYDDFDKKLRVYSGLELFEFPNYNQIKEYKKYIFQTPKKIARVSDTGFIVSNYNKLFFVDAKKHKRTHSVDGRSRLVAYNKKNKLMYVDFSKGLKIGKTLSTLKNITYNTKNIYSRAFAVKKNTPYVYIANNQNKILEIKDTTIVSTIELSHNEKVNTLMAGTRYLWIGTDKGLFYYDYDKNKIEKFKKLFNIQIKKVQVTKNFIWVTSDDKIIRIPLNFKDFKFIEPVPYFKNIKIGNTLCKVNQEITLEANDENLNIEFMINGYNRLENYKLQYRITQGNWQSIDGNKISLSGLSYGSQEIEVRGISKEKKNITPTTKLAIVVLQPFYKTYWFLLFLLGLFLFVNYNLVKFYIKRQDKRKKKVLKELKTAQKLTNLKLENLRSQMNPHFIFNALNSIQEYIYNSDKHLASSYLVKFSSLIRIYLEHSRVSEISLAEEITALKLYLYLENDRFDGKLDYTIDIDNSIDTRSICVPSLFIQPYIENSIKHGLLHKKDTKKLDVIFSLTKTKTKQKKMIVIVRDNGIGRRSSEKLKSNRYHKSFATSANIDRVALMNLNRNQKIEVKTNDLYNKNSESIGTEVVIAIPLINKEYKL